VRHLRHGGRIVTGDRLALATRTMKARRSSTCTICRGPVTAGQAIARLTSPAAWVHVRCVPAVAAALARNPQTATEGTTRP
jgi:hypothetical protein